MNRKAYSQTYNQVKTIERQRMNEAIERLKSTNPQRFAELEAQAKHELEHPPERPIIRHTLHKDISIDETFEQWRNGRKDYYVYTIDCWNGEHLYFETLVSPEQAIEVMQRHPKFSERGEKITSVVPCICPLCS